MTDALADIKSIFGKVLELRSPEEREFYLAQACGGDASVRAEIDSLLQAQEAAARFFAGIGPVPADTVDLPLEHPGSQIGPYKLLQQIGEGGFGVVYMAEQLAPVRRKVALKVIKPGMDTRQVIARFEAERQALAVMEHPNIAKVLDAGTVGQVQNAECRVQSKNESAPAPTLHSALRTLHSDGRPYFVMELVRGIPITQYCDENSLSIRARLELFAIICHAIQHAHTKGIIHRDIKPTNVLVTQQDGEPVAKVIDFGIAKAMGQQLTEKTLFTEFAQMIGTPQYMSPEQAAMSSVDIDTRSDIYSLGVLLYELLTGSTPISKEQFKQANFDEIRRIIREDEAQRPSLRISASGTLPAIAAHRHVEPGRLRMLVRGELDWIVMKCLEKDRNRRYESAGSLGRDVERHLRDEPVLACPPSTLYWLRKLAKRHKGGLISLSAVALAALLAVAALVVSTGLVWQANQVLRREVSFQRITVAHRELSTDNLAAALQALRECPEDLREWEWHYLMRRCMVEPLVIQNKSEVIGVSFSPNGERLASASGDGAVRIWNSTTGELILEFPAAHDKGACSVVFHPKGNYLASAGADGWVKVWDLETRQVVFKGPCDALRKFGAAYTVAFSPPDGRYLAAGSAGRVQVWDWKENRPQVPAHEFPGHKRNSIPVAFSRNGQRLATGTWNGPSVWDMDTGRPLGAWPAHHYPVSALAFSPDGSRLATASLDRSVKLWDTKSGELVHHPFLHTGNVLGVAFSSDGKRLASTGEDKTVRVWDTTTGREVLGLRGHTDSCACVTFSPDGWRLASASLDGTIRVWDATPLRGDEGQETTFAPHGEEIRSVAVSPDGEKLVAAGHGGLLKVWDTASGRSIVEIPSHKVIVFSVAWHPDNLRIASAGSDGPQLAVKVWDVRSRRKLFEILASESFAVPFQVVAFSPGPEGRYLVTGSQNGAVEVWDATTGGRVGMLGTHDREIRGLLFSPDGKYLASTSGDGRINLWDATRLDQAQEPRVPALRARVPGPSLNVAFSPDSQRLATGGIGNTVKIWDVQTGKELKTLRGHNGDVYSLAFSPNDQCPWIASGGEDSTVKIWDSRTFEEVRTFRGHTGVVSSLAFSPDGKRLYSGSRDTTVKVWDLTQLRQVPER